jgi:hypothetical protein
MSTKCFLRKHNVLVEYGVFEFPSVSGSVSVSESNGFVLIAAAFRKNLVDTDSDTDPDTDSFELIFSME